MNIAIEFALVVFLYFFVFSLALKFLGGKKLIALEEEMRKAMERYRKTQKIEDAKRVNLLAMKRFRELLRVQLPLLPVLLVFFYFLKKRYSFVVFQIGPLKLGWFGTLLLFGFLLGPIAERAALIIYKKVKKA